MTPPTPTVTTTAPRTADRRRTRNRRGHPRALRRQPHSDADVYAGIARAWWTMHRPAGHHEHPMRTYLVCPGFAEEVWGHPDIDSNDVFAVCARLVALEDYRVRETATITRKDEGLSEALDPLRGWWLPLTNTPGLGVHFWQLVLVPVELRCIGPVDDPPSLQYGRFPERAVRGCP
jgi:hypothetical protein